LRVEVRGLACLSSTTTSADCVSSPYCAKYAV
jgi:hypothetical protein